jgi:hypothetical protein
MNRMDINAGFYARIEVERQSLPSGYLGDHDGKVCPGSNIKVGDDVLCYGQVVRVVGGIANDPLQFYAAYLDWSISNMFVAGPFPCFDAQANDAPAITDRAPADPEDTDPIYVEPPP